MTTTPAVAPLVPEHRRFLRTRKLAGRIACHPATGRLIALLMRDRIPHRGCWIDTSCRSIKPQLKARLLWGVYEQAETRFVRAHLRPDLDVIELGSSLGVVASHIARKLLAGRRLICVEANAQLIDSLTRNVATNAPHISHTVIHAAIDPIASQRTTVPFRCADDHTASAVEESESGDSAEVPVISLSELVHDLPAYCLVADIEGAEAAIVETEMAALARCQQLIIELHDSNYAGHRVTVDSLVHWLQDVHGFTLRRQCGTVYLFERGAA